MHIETNQHPARVPPQLLLGGERLDLPWRAYLSRVGVFDLWKVLHKSAPLLHWWWLTGQQFCRVGLPNLARMFRLSAQSERLHPSNCWSLMTGESRILSQERSTRKTERIE
ncbi:hypothetical protein RRG08_033196 [Elysia crispata]|uniref:Uncharacterized protein n=1 Tax=Elysia crispata TaxID=231223 RepID=A0AAE1BAF6_9GAST|nr:hypothetical protein RRG08_033196 [Elysia crispata]